MDVGTKEIRTATVMERPARGIEGRKDGETESL